MSTSDLAERVRAAIEETMRIARAATRPMIGQSTATTATPHGPAWSFWTVLTPTASTTPPRRTPHDIPC